MCLNNRLEVVNYLLQSNVNSKYLVDGILLAHKNGYVNIMNRIIEHGIDLTLYSYKIFYHASVHGNSELIKILIGSGLVLQSNEPLELVCRYDNVELAKFYLLLLS